MEIKSTLRRSNQRVDSLEKIKKIDKFIAELYKRERKPKLIKLDIKEGRG